MLGESVESRMSRQCEKWLGRALDLKYLDIVQNFGSISKI